MRVAEAYYRLLGATLLSLIAADAWNGMWQLHAGVIYPYRHVKLFPLYPPAELVTEWVLLGVAAAGLWLDVRRPLALWLAALVVLLSLTQHYSNHATLTFMVLLFTAAHPPASDSDLARPNMLLVRWQLAIVYVFSGLTKLLAGFPSGRSLANLFLVIRDPLLPRELFAVFFRDPLVVVLSVAVVAFELFVPLVLWRWPRTGIALVALFHAAITVLMPGVIAYGLIMLTMSVLYLHRPGTRDDSYIRSRTPRAGSPVARATASA